MWLIQSKQKNNLVCHHSPSTVTWVKAVSLISNCQQMSHSDHYHIISHCCKNEICCNFMKTNTLTNTQMNLMPVLCLSVLLCIYVHVYECACV